MNKVPERLSGAQLFRSFLLFCGAFLISFILNSYIIHEAGHAFGGMLFGCKIESLQINPLWTGDWRSQCPSPTQMTSTGILLQGMGGPIFGIPLSIAITAISWRKRRPELLPLVMSAPVVFITNYLGVLDSIQNYPDHIFDYGWLLSQGIPTSDIRLIGFSSLVIGIIMMNLLLPLVGVGIKEPFWKVLILHLSTWPPYMLMRLLYQASVGLSIDGPLTLLFFGVFLSILTSLPSKPIRKFTSRFIQLEPVMPSPRGSYLLFGLGLSLTIVLAVSFPI